MELIKFSLMCKALGDPTRLQIFEKLKKSRLCACNILKEFQITQPTLSYHMKALTSCGLVVCQKDGKWCYYSVNSELLKNLANFLTKSTKFTK